MMSNVVGRVAVLVDAGYLFKAGGHLLLGRNAGREELVLDIASAVTQLEEVANEITGRELLRVYWYDAAHRDPRAEHRDIAETHDVKLRLGHLNSAGQQKGVDPLIITDMMTLARNRACDDFVLLSGDADLVAGVLQAQEHGVRVHVLGIAPTRQNQAPTLRYEADTCHEWNAAAVRELLRTATPEEIAERKRMPARRRTDRVVAAADAAENGERPALTAVGKVSGISDVTLQAVVSSLVRELTPDECAEVAGGDKPGLVPGSIDRRLLGTARMMLHTMLAEPEKRVLRHMLYEACVATRAPQPAAS